MSGWRERSVRLTLLLLPWLLVAAGISCGVDRIVEVPVPPPVCRVPAFPEIPDDVPWRDCDGAIGGDSCMSPDGLATLGAVILNIAEWRDEVLRCPGVHAGGVTARFSGPFSDSGVAEALRSLSARMGVVGG